MTFLRIIFPAVAISLAVSGCKTEPTEQSSALDRETIRTLKEENIDFNKINCNNQVHWRQELGGLSKQATKEIFAALEIEPEKQKRKEVEHIVLGYLVRELFVLLKPNNLGVTRLKNRYYQDSAGKKKPLLVFRSGTMTDASKQNSCLQSLLREGRVAHVLNFYAGDFPLHDFIAEEKNTALACGASYHNEAEMGRPWRRLIEDPEDYEKNKPQAVKYVTAIINDQILFPSGKPPRGNILIHCGGGMHRTGMIFGILERCINERAILEIEDDYKAHTGYLSPEKPGGYEELNVKFISEFDCDLLKAP